MTAIKRYNQLRETGSQYGDDGFCSVVAIAVALGITYEQSWTLHKKAGRVTNEGTFTHTTLGILDTLGVEYKHVRVAAKTVKSFRYRGNFIIFTSGHALCHQYGETLDHSAGTRRHIQQVFKITSIPSDIHNQVVAEPVVTKPKRKRKVSPNKYALVHVDSRKVVKLYSRKPTVGIYRLGLNTVPNSVGTLKYIKFNEDLFLGDREAFWEVAGLKSSEITTKQDKQHQYLNRKK